MATHESVIYSLRTNKEDFEKYYPIKGIKLNTTTSEETNMRMLGFGAANGYTTLSCERFSYEPSNAGLHFKYF